MIKGIIPVIFVTLFLPFIIPESPQQPYLSIFGDMDHITPKPETFLEEVLGHAGDIAGVVDARVVAALELQGAEGEHVGHSFYLLSLDLVIWIIIFYPLGHFFVKGVVGEEVGAVQQAHRWKCLFYIYPSLHVVSSFNALVGRLTFYVVAVKVATGA